MYLLVDIFEFQLKLSLFLVPLGHHLIEVSLDLDHLTVQTSQLLIWSSCLLVHLFLSADCLLVLFFELINYNKLF